jgi:hypothetical protein
MSNQFQYRSYEPLEPEFIPSNKFRQPISKTNEKILYIVTTQHKKDLKPFQVYTNNCLPYNTAYIHGVFLEETNTQIYTKNTAITSIKNNIKTAKIKVSKGAKYKAIFGWYKKIKNFKGTIIYVGIDFFIKENIEYGCIIMEYPDGREERNYTGGYEYPEIYVKEAQRKGFVKQNLGRVTVSKTIAKECSGIDHKNPWKWKTGMDRQDIIMEALTLKLGLDWDHNSPPNWRKNKLLTE